MKKILYPIAITLVFSFNVFAQYISSEELAGKWEFVSWEEADDPSTRKEVGILMDFHKDGTVTSHMENGPQKSNYSIEGDSIKFSDDRGEQVQRIVEFIPGQRLIINHMGALMRLERR
ncbi:MAG: lipocalin family protein [Arenicellales bacterium]|jgi:hypothetical protein